MPKIKTTPAEHAARWKSHLDAAGPQIEAGVRRVTEAPGIAAARQEEKFKIKILDAIESHRWANEVKKVTLESWQDSMIKIGIGRIRSGTEAALPEVEEFAAALYPHIEAGQRALEEKPSVTLQDNLARMVFFCEHMAGFTFRGG